MVDLFSSEVRNKTMLTPVKSRLVLAVLSKIESQARFDQPARCEEIEYCVVLNRKAFDEFERSHRA